MDFNIEKAVFWALLSLTAVLNSVSVCGAEPTAAVSGKTLVMMACDITAKGLADGDPRIRCQAAEAAAKSNKIELIAQTAKLLSDEVMPVRFTAAVAVGDSKYSVAKRQLKKLLADENLNVVMAAGYALAKLGDERFIGYIEKAAASRDATLRANSAFLMGKTGKKEFLPTLYRIKNDENSADKARFAAVSAIAMLGDEKIYPKIWTMLISTYADDRVIGIEAMGNLQTFQARNALITMLDDDVLEVRMAAAGELGKFGDKSGETIITDFFEDASAGRISPNPLQKIQAGSAIGNIASKGLIKYLPTLLKDENAEVRLAAAAAAFGIEESKN